MAKCKPAPKVRAAGRKLSQSTSQKVKSAAGKTLANHRHQNH